MGATPATFAQSNNLTAHMRTHAGGKETLRVRHVQADLRALQQSREAHADEERGLSDSRPAARPSPCIGNREKNQI